jgi:hypothetical protein
MEGDTRDELGTGFKNVTRKERRYALLELIGKDRSPI